MANRPRRKSDAARRANQVIRGRTMLVMVLLGVATFTVLFMKLYDLQINQYDTLHARAVGQQTDSSVISASRGTIYDKNGEIMAISYSAETVYVDPHQIQLFVESQQEDIQAAAEKAAENGETYTAPEVLDQAYIARGLSRILEVDEDTILEQLDRTSNKYWVVKSKVDQDVADEVRRFINGEIDEEGNQLTTTDADGNTVLISTGGRPKRLQGIALTPDTKRLYPFGSLAGNVIGFVNAQNVGSYGLESAYDDVLNGSSGLTVTATDVNGTPLLYNYEQYYDAENGNSLVLTLDTNVQYYLEKGLESMLDKYDAKYGGTGIVMDVNSGAILAMASYPNYDPSDYSTIYSDQLQELLDAELAEIQQNRSSYKTEEEYQTALDKALGNAQNQQWRNKCYQDTYEPGSTYKPITLAMALEEGLVNMNSTFNCTGVVQVGPWQIHCSKRSGHGLQILKEAVGNSCNTAFIDIGSRVGGEKYYEYMESFGLLEETGVDLVGEATGIANQEGLLTDASALASYSFGQTFTVTPLELIRAQAATINGGYLYTPYLVEQVLDDEGNVISQHEPQAVRQVISEETSAKVRECLEWVISDGGGRNGQVAGYRIGGKTGTADKTGTRNTTREVVVSFMCFAPADDPQIIMLLTMDTPSRTTGTAVYGGTMVAPVASQIMSEILPQLGIEPDYTAEELVGADTTVPNLVGETRADAEDRLESLGFSYRTVGDGDTVTDQTPVGGAIVPGNATIILYLGEEKPDTPCTVPNVVGMTASAANKAITNAGLIMKVTGTTSASSGNVYAITQSIPGGTEAAAGTVVTVQFGDNSVLD